MSGPKHPILQCLETLRAQAEVFLDEPEARVLRWLATPGERKLITSFLDLEQQETGKLSALLMRFDTPFGPGYDGALTEALVMAYSAQREELRAAGHPARWVPPAGEHRAFVDVCASYQRDHADLIPRVLVVLWPTEIDDLERFQGFVLDLARRAPPELRVLVVDDASAPQLRALGDRTPLVNTTRASLDVDQALASTAAGMPDAAQPSGKLRAHLLALAKAAGSKDLNGVDREAEAALVIAKAQQWPAMVVTVECARAAALMGVPRLEDACRAYQRADEAARACVEAGEPAGQRLRLIARMGEGSTHVARGSWAAGAVVYESCAPLAEACGDGLMTFEAWRLAAWCHEQAGAKSLAWERGQKALTIAEGLTSAQRQTSTLPWLGACLLRLSAKRLSLRSEAAIIDARITSMMGDRQWRQRAEGTQGAA